MEFIKWSNVAILGNNKVVVKSYIYLIIVPILARMLNKLESPFQANLTSDYILIIDLKLPFNWVLFYFAALCFTFGTIIYSLFAPTIFKEEQSFGDFEFKKKTSLHLKMYLNDIGITDKFIQKNTGIEITEIVQNNLSSIAPGEILSKLANWYQTKTTNSEINEKVSLYYNYWRTKTEIQYSLQDLFWEIYDYAKKYNYAALIVSFIFYALGLGLIAYIFIQSFIAVISNLCN